MRTSLALAAALPVILAAPTLVTPAAAAPAQTVTVHVDASAPGRTIPRDFMGLSFEAWQLHHQWTDPAQSNVAALVANLGRSHLRFSANAVDETAWQPDPSADPPQWAEGDVITPQDLSRLAAFTEATGWDVDLGVNLKHYDPDAAADEVAQARERLGDALRSVQIGNEPNLYLSGDEANQPYLQAQDYVTDARAYRSAIEDAVPGTDIEGPDTAGVFLDKPAIDSAIENVLIDPWLDAYAQAFGDAGTALNQHYYPFVNIDGFGLQQGSLDALGGLPTVDDLMSPETAQRQTRFLRGFVDRAHAAGLEPRLTETNSMANEGRHGVTNSFGAALWTIDYSLTAADEGIDEINLHGHMNDCGSYSLFCFADESAEDAGHADVNPNYYAALMIERMVGGELLPVTVDADGTHVTAYAVRAQDGSVRVLVDNLDRGFDGNVRVEVDGGSDGAATEQAAVQRLTAPSPDATDGAQFAGATVNPDGSFAAGPGERVDPADGGYTMPLADPGALLLTVGE